MNNEQSTIKKRAGLIDELRGLDIIVMTIYHACYDLVFIFGAEVPHYRSFAMPYVQPGIAWLFIALSGISCRYSRSNAKRGLRTLILGLGLSIVTILFMPGQAIYFGILHFMGTAMLLFAALRPVTDKIPVPAGIVCSLLLFLLTLRMPDMPDAPLWLMPLGFGGMGADYFPLMPNFFLFLAGSYLGVYVAAGKAPEWFYATRLKFLAAIGRRTIIIYLLHQPVLMGIFTLIFQ